MFSRPNQLDLHTASFSTLLHNTHIAHPRAHLFWYTLHSSQVMLWGLKRAVRLPCSTLSVFIQQSQEAEERFVHRYQLNTAISSLHKEVSLWNGVVEAIHNCTHCIVLGPTPSSNKIIVPLFTTSSFASVSLPGLFHNGIALGCIWTIYGNGHHRLKCRVPKLFRSLLLWDSKMEIHPSATLSTDI